MHINRCLQIEISWWNHFKTKPVAKPVFFIHLLVRSSVLCKERKAFRGSHNVYIQRPAKQGPDLRAKISSQHSACQHLLLDAIWQISKWADIYKTSWTHSSDRSTPLGWKIHLLIRCLTSGGHPKWQTAKSTSPLTWYHHVYASQSVDILRSCSNTSFKTIWFKQPPDIKEKLNRPWAFCIQLENPQYCFKTLQTGLNALANT